MADMNTDLRDIVQVLKSNIHPNNGVNGGGMMEFIAEVFTRWNTGYTTNLPTANRAQLGLMRELKLGH